MEGLANDKFHSGIELRPGFSAGADLYTKRRFVTLYLLSCEDTQDKINRLVLADPTQKRCEVLFDLFDKAECEEGWTYYDSLYRDSFKVTPDGRERSERKVSELRPTILEQLRCKIEEAASVRTVEYLRGVFTADTVVDAYLHLLRRGKPMLRGGRSYCVISYDDLSEVLANALQSEDRTETVRQFVRPLLDHAVGLRRPGMCHAWRCAQAVRDGMESIDEDEASELVVEMVDWKMLSLFLMRENMVRYVEIVAEMKIDPRVVTAYINDFYDRTYPGFNEECIDALHEPALDALSAYYLDVLDVNGQTRLKKIADDCELIGGLPRELISHLLDGFYRLSIKYPKEAVYLKVCLCTAWCFGRGNTSDWYFGEGDNTMDLCFGEDDNTLDLCFGKDDCVALD
ncbi:hypothetical protein PAPHI01_1411 [Pancytospora philotis]|nr:hypothetical protein PAPHI01_1411 [Pancytospora philotis]